MSTSGFIPMIGPDGSVADVHPDSVNAALAKGAKLGIDMTAPDGSIATVPRGAPMIAAIRKGARPVDASQGNQQTQFEKDRPGNSSYIGDFISNIANMAKGSVQGVQPGGYPDVQYQPGKGLQETPSALSIKQQAFAQGQQAAQGRRAATGQEGFAQAYPQAYRAVAPLVPNAPAMEQAARQGDTTGVNAAWDAAVAPIALGKAIPVVADAMPSKARAGANFQTAMKIAGDQPIEVTPDLSKAALAARDLFDAGSPNLPPVIRKFMARVTDPEQPPMTYAEARKFYMNATRMSAEQAGKMNKPMFAQLAQFTKALGESIQGAADEAGAGQYHRAAMSEFKSASRVQDTAALAGDTLKGLLTRGIPAAGAAYSIHKIIQGGR